MLNKKVDKILLRQEKEGLDLSKKIDIEITNKYQTKKLGNVKITIKRMQDINRRIIKQ